MEAIEIFQDYLRKALTMVHNDYYGLHHWNEPMLNAVMGDTNSENKAVIQEYLDRYGERVFCYELYHQIRTLMDEHSKTNPETFKDLRLQSELKKDYINEIVQAHYGVQALDSEYIPDFLLHTPGNFDKQYLILEVKSNPKISFSGMIDDLKKIQQFISRYRYERGIFLTINTNPKRILNTLKSENSITWLKKIIQTPNQIHIMCKEKNDVELLELKISDLTG